MVASKNKVYFSGKAAACGERLIINSFEITKL